MTLTADDGDGGLSQSVFQVVVANVAPTITSLGGDSTGDEMATLYWYAYSSDPGDDTVTYEWDYGDGTDSQVASYGAHAYADDGVYTLTVTASDEDGGSTTDTMQVTVLNVAPAFTSVDVPASANEGETKTFTAAATDVAEDIDDLAYSWNFGDGTPAALGDSVEHAFADDGEYSVTVTVVDGDGGSTPSSATVVVYNVAPEIISSAPEYALENVTYTYNIVVEDPGDEVFSFTLSPSAPSAMSIDPDYGIVSWTPNYDDSLVGSFAVTVTVDDGDGDTDVQTWTIQVGYADDDVDGMADDWEEANGLDSSDGGDGILDSDGDGVTNVEEFLSGTDPQVFDGPETPVIVSPMDDEEVETSVPTLTWENAYDPQLDVITYETEVWLDAAMTLLFDGASEIVEDSSGESTWKVENALTENSTVWWRVRAHDGSVESPWSDPASFVVNEINEAPGQPVAISPIDDVVVAVEYPLLEWSLVEDGDGDAVTYAVEIWGDDPDTILVSSDALSFDEETDLYGGWVVDVILAENRTYYWSVTATDEHELDSDASVPAAFYYSLENEAPDVVEWVSPVDGEIVEADSPDLTATESTDPEGESVSYRFEVDLVETFDSADLVSGTAEHSGSGTVTWRTGDDGVVLPSNTTVFARVRAEDPEGVPSAWAVISFFVAGTNDPPEVPTLLSPEDGSTTEVLVPVLVAGHVTDPEGDGLFYDFVVASDVQLTAVIAEVSGVVGGSGPEGSEEQVSWQVPINMDGTVYWSARSVDVGGAASEWAVPFTLIVSGGEDELPQEVVDALAGGGPTSGCNCESSVAGGQPGSAWALLLLLVPALRRRRGSA